MRLLIVFIFLFCSLEASSYGLLDIYSRSINSDQYMKANMYSYKSAELESKVSKSYLLPNISLAAEYVNYYSEGNNNTSNNISLNVNQPLFNMKALYLYDEASENIKLQKYLLISKYNNREIELVSDYLDLICAYNVSKSIKSQLDFIKLAKESSELAYKLGSIAKLDLDDARSRFADIESKYIYSNNSISSALDKLEQYSDLKISEIYTIKDFDTTVFIRKLSDDKLLYKQALNAPEIKAKSEEYLMSELDEKSAYYSSGIYVSGFLKYVKPKVLDANEKGAFNYGISLQLPLFAAGYYNSQVAAKHNLAISKLYELRYLKKKYKTLMHTELMAIKNDKLIVDARKKSISASKELVSSSKVAYKLGTIRLVDLMQVLAKHSKNQADYFEAIKNSIIHYLQFVSILGQINKKDIEFIDSLMDKKDLLKVLN